MAGGFVGYQFDTVIDSLLAGGTFSDYTSSSVLTLLPDAADWTDLPSLPRPLEGARASIVGGTLRLAGGLEVVGDGDGSYRSEVMAHEIVV